jgi:peptide deformylase
VAAPAAAETLLETLSPADDAPPLEVVRLGHPVLRSVADPVPEEWFGSGRLDRLARGLVRTMLAEHGVGLAAPQVAEELRIFAYWVPGRDGAAEIEPSVVVNPEIRIVDPGLEEDWEGCLSIPGLRGLVPRARRIKVKGRSIDGEPMSLTADGFHARVIQHEFDHLDGVVFLDRMSSVHSLAFEEEWERYILTDSDSAAED